MLDPSCVLSKVDGKPQRVLLAPASPDIIIDGGSAGAVATFPSGASIVTALIDNAYAPTTSWTAAGNPQAVSGSTRRVLRHADRDAIPVVVNWS